MSTNNVHITNIDWNESKIPRWATEHLQKQIVALLETQTFLVTKDTEEGKKLQKKLTEIEKARIKGDTKRTEKLLDELGSGTKKTSSKLGEMTASIGNFTTNLTNALIVRGASIEKVILGTLQNFVDATKKMPFFGALLAPLIIASHNLAKTLQEAHMAYTELYDRGLGLSRGFVALISAAGDANMSVSDFSAAASQSSRVIIAFNKALGTANTGLLTYANVSKMLRDSLLDVGQLGLSLGEVNDFLSDYLEGLRLRGVLEQINERRLAAATRSYLETLTELSRVTGVQRDQISDSIQQTVRAPDIAEVYRNLTENQQKAADKMFGFIGTFEGEAQTMLDAMFRDVLKFGRTGITAGTQEFISILQNEAPGVVSALEQYGKTLSPDSFISFVREIQEFAASAPGRRKLAELTQFTEGAGPVLSFFQQLGQYDPDRFKPNEYQDSLTEFFNNMETILQRIAGPFRTAFAEGLMALNDVLGVDGEGGFITQIQDSLIGFANWIRSGLVPYFKKDFKGHMENIANILGGIFAAFTGEEATEAEQKALNNFTSWLERMLNTMWNEFLEITGRFFENALAEIPGIGAFFTSSIERTSNALASLASQMKKQEEIIASSGLFAASPEEKREAREELVKLRKEFLSIAKQTPYNIDELIQEDKNLFGYGTSPIERYRGLIDKSPTIQNQNNNNQQTPYMDDEAKELLREQNNLSRQQLKALEKLGVKIPGNSGVVY